jgi:hypothetical protein
MSSRPDAPTPLTLTTNPRLDAAVQAGWEAWAAAARAAGPAATAAWLAHRADEAASATELRPLVAAVLRDDDADETIAALAELAELAEGFDDALADSLWEGVLAAAREAEDADALFEATGRLAAIAEAHGDQLAAAEYWIGFLNWRREGGHDSDPEQVDTAFDEVVRLAERDGAPKAAALFAFRQAQYTRLLEAEDDRATAGEWEAEGAGAYEGWA